MERYFLHSSFHLATSEAEDRFVERLAVILNCNFRFVEEDEDGDKYWRGANLGFTFSLCRNAQGRLAGIYSLNIAPVPRLHHEAPSFRMDFHFISLLRDAGIDGVITNDELADMLKPTSDCRDDSGQPDK